MPDSLASCPATEAATKEIIKVLTSHNSRLRPRFDRFDVAISFRPCSDIEVDYSQMQARRVESYYATPSSSHAYNCNYVPEYPCDDADSRNDIIWDSTAAAAACELQNACRSLPPCICPSQGTICRQPRAADSETTTEAIPPGGQHRPLSIPPPARPCHSTGHISIAGSSASSFRSTLSDSDASRAIRPRQRLWKRLLGCLGTSRAAALD
uniref:Uncharacterized protein n=1 Tax=Cryptomonas curvata TaxID=233186 RepID=A0A7S0NCE5_9CRYP